MTSVDGTIHINHLNIKVTDVNHDSRSIWQTSIVLAMLHGSV